MSRLTKDEYYLNIALDVSKRSTCLRRKYGAVIVNKDQIISTGYCGAPRGTVNCSDINVCVRKESKVNRGEHYEWCRGVHAEQNAIIHASRLNMIKSKLYLVGVNADTDTLLEDAEPCPICKRLIINAGIIEVITLNKNGAVLHIDVKKEWIDTNIHEIAKVGNKWVSTIKK